MTFWIAAAALTVLTVAAVLWPLFRRTSTEHETPEYDLAVYRDQLAEVDRNLERGTIGEAEAKAARTEIHRRILAADQRLQDRPRKRGSDSGGRGGAWASWTGAIAVGGAVPLASLLLYLNLGSPQQEALPLASRDDAQPTAQMARGQSGEARTEETAELASDARQLAGRLEIEGGTLEDWVTLGRMRMGLGQYDEATMAFETARSLAPEDPIVGVFYAEALVMSLGGMVTPQARRVLEAAAEREPNQPRINYYLALGDMQAGRSQAALERWAGIARRSEPDAPWLGPVSEQMERAEQDLDIAPGTTFRQARAEAEESAPAVAGGPTREQMQAAEDMSDEERAEMIDGMVARLAERLEENPHDLEGWVRLARAYSVQDRPEEAADAMAKAVEQAPEDLELLAQYARTLRAAGGNERVGESLRVSQKILELDPDNTEALWFVAMYQLAQGNVDTAGDMFDRALAQLPEGSGQRDDLRRQADRLLEQMN